jgi:hypothetical protein
MRKQRSWGGGGVNSVGKIYKICINRINIVVKFSCRLYLEYHNAGVVTKYKEIRLDPKLSNYEYNEEIVLVGEPKNREKWNR